MLQIYVNAYANEIQPNAFEIFNLGHPVQNLRHDARQMENFSIQIGQVSHGEDKKRFQNSGMVGKSGDKTRDVAPNDANEGTTKCDDKEACEAFEDILMSDVISANFHVGFKHLIKYLIEKT